MSNAKPFAAAPGWGRVGPDGGGGTPREGYSTDTLLRAILDVLNLQTPILAAIMDELQQWSPEGYVVPRTQTLTTTVPIEVPFSPPLFTLGITNDGPGVIRYRVPNRGGADWVNLFPTEVIQVNFIKAKIVSIGLTMLVAGAATTVRLVGTY